MPVPKPSGGESQDDYISRCVSWADDEHPEMDEDQRLAMCFDTYRGGKEKSTKAEILKELKHSLGRLGKSIKARLVNK